MITCEPSFWIWSECGVDNSPDSVLDPIKMPGRSLLMKMDAAPAKMLATMTLMKGTPRKMSAVTETPAARDAMKLRYRAAMGMGSPFAKAMRILAMMETKETYEEDEDVGDTKLLPRRAAAVKPSPRRAAAAKLLAKGTTLLAMRQAARELGLGSDRCHDDCSPQMRCSPEKYCSREMYGCPKMQEMYGCPEMTAATENHERFDTTSPFPPVEDRMQDYKVFGASTNLTALQPGRWSISSSVQCCQAALQLQTLVPCGAGSSAAAYCCALQRFAEQASVDCEPAQHQAPRHHTWPGAARCVGKTDPPRPVKRGDSDSRKIHDQTKIPIPEQFQQVVS